MVSTLSDQSKHENDARRIHNLLVFWNWADIDTKQSISSIFPEKYRYSRAVSLVAIPLDTHLGQQLKQDEQVLISKFHVVFKEIILSMKSYFCNPRYFPVLCKTITFSCCVCAGGHPYVPCISSRTIKSRTYARATSSELTIVS